MSKIYLYLARGDQKDVKIIADFYDTNNSINPTRINDVKTLHLPPSMEEEISLVVEKHKMLWQLWIESADSMNSLRETLRTRGYGNVQNSSLRINTKGIIHNNGMPVSPSVKTKNRKTMIRRVSP